MSDSGKGLQKNSAAYLQARANGFGAPGQSRPQSKTEEMTDLITDMALEHGQDMTAMALQALTDGMRAHDVKQRVDAAKAYLHNFHQPSKQIDMNVNEQVSISPAAREATDALTDEEQAVMEAFEAKLLALRQEREIEGEVVGEEHDDIEVAEVVEPEPTLVRHRAEDLPPLPPLPSERPK